MITAVANSCDRGRDEKPALNVAIHRCFAVYAAYLENSTLFARNQVPNACEYVHAEEKFEGGEDPAQHIIKSVAM